MKHFLTALSGLAGLVATCFLLPAALSQDAGQAGAARVDITPESSIRLSGYGSRTAPSEGIESPLYARALALKDPEGVLTVLVSVDSIGVPAWVRERVVGAIRDRLGIYHVRLLVSSTHTHTGPSLEEALTNLLVMTPDETEAVRKYTRTLIQQMVKAIEGALESLEPATLHHGKALASFGRNRRQAGGPVDHELPVLLVKNSKGKPVAVVFNYACHATTLGGEFNRVCGDWPGYASEFIEAANPGAVAFPLIGCGADQNPHPRGKLDQAKAHGREIAAAVEGILKGPLIPLPSKIDAQLEYVSLPFATQPTEEELRARLKDGPEHVRRHARKQLERIAREGSLPRALPYPIQVFDFGKELTMVFLAGEVVVDFAIRLRRELSPRNLWITAYSNDVPCYIPSRRILSEGGYEADDSMFWYGQPTRFDPSVEETIVEKVRALVAGSESAVGRVKPPLPLSPREALQTFRLPEGLRIELAAAEPEVTDPVAIAFDERGYLYAAEMRDYPLGPGEGKPFDGRIRVLWDADLDGYFERSSLLAENVPYPTGIACSRGGIYVTCAPDLIYLKDTDGDGRADLRQVVYTGFNVGNSQHLLNTLKRGIDNWIYLNGGDYATVCSPADPRLPELKASGQSFRFNPGTLEIQLTTGYRGGYGIAFGLHGERFVCDNQAHAVHVALPRTYLARNSDLRVEETMHEISDHGARVYAVSKPLERFNDPRDAGRFSSASGVHIYQGDGLPEAYRGSHFVCEPVSNLVHRDVLVPSGASFIARRGEEGSEFLASTDHWFRPVSCDTGPDGALYIVDMYREVIEHPQWIPEHLQKLFDLRSGMDRGRIYRVIRGERPPRSRVELASAGAQELLKHLSHPNAWWRETAQRLLLERRIPGAAAALERTLREAPEPLGRLHALWTLEGLKALTPEIVLAALDDSYPPVRSAGALLTEGFLAGGDPAAAGAPRTGALKTIRERIVRLAGDPDPGVRFQAAFSLGALSPEERIAPLEKIALRDSGDPWTRTAILTSLNQGPVPVLRALVDTEASGAGHSKLIEGLSTLVGTRKRSPEVRSALLTLTREIQPERGPRLIPALTALLSSLGPEGLQRVLEENDPQNEAVRKRLSALFEIVGKWARDESRSLKERKEAVSLLGHDATASTLALLTELLNPRYPQDLVRSAVASLARLPGSAVRREVTALLLGAFPAQTPSVRGEVLDALLSSRERTTALFSALESGQIHPREIDLSRRKLLLEHPSKEVSGRAARVFSDLLSDPDRASLVERYRKALGGPGLTASGDLKRGEELFLKHCSTCHRAGERGAAVGADLSGMRSRSVDALLEDILDPSRAVAPEYLSYTLMAKDRRLLTGILVSETPTSLTLRQAEGKTDSVLRREIAELRSTGQSLMPEGLEKELGPEDVRDIIAFVRGGLISFGGPSSDTAPAGPASLREALSFHAPFDSTPHAAFSRGDPKIYTASELMKRDGREGLLSGNVVIATGKGRYGDALQFRKKEKPAVHFRAEKNLAYQKSNWSGTVSLWLSLDPEKDLEPGYADPIQITEREWNDAAFFVDFSKDDRPRHFRLGVFADRSVWDPQRRNWDSVPLGERPMVDISRQVFARGKWTHVVWVYSSFNTGKDNGLAKLYIDGELQGTLEKRRQTFTWDPAQTSIWLGLSYIGLLDDLAIFDRTLSDDEIRTLYRLEGGVGSLRRSSI